MRSRNARQSMAAWPPGPQAARAWWHYCRDKPAAYIDILRREVSGRLPRDAPQHSSDASQTITNSRFPARHLRGRLPLTSEQRRIFSRAQFKKLPELGKGIGEGIRGFKSAMKEGAEPSEKTSTPEKTTNLPRSVLIRRAALERCLCPVPTSNGFP